MSGMAKYFQWSRKQEKKIPETDPKFEVGEIFRNHRICLCNDRNEVDPRSQPFHDLYIEGFDPDQS